MELAAYDTMQLHYRDAQDKSAWYALIDDGDLREALLQSIPRVDAAQLQHLTETQTQEAVKKQERRLLLQLLPLVPGPVDPGSLVRLVPDP